MTGTVSSCGRAILALTVPLTLWAGIACAELPASLSQTLRKSGIPESHVGILVQEIGNPVPLLAHGENRSFNPASVMKLVTTLAALDSLGPAYTFRTRVYTQGALVDGVLQGNLIVQGGGDPCKREGSVDCWTTRLVHALQESVEEDGSGGIRIDGGKFAKRLAQHGDDFRRHHEWRGYLHLTVGVGGLYSDPIDTGMTATNERRTVPLISEQIGAGLASPTFFGERLTFKVGMGASGLLYRAALDSAESNAIMVHPIFFALDISDLVEAYVSPAMLMLYPPEDGRDTQVRWGFSAGISVPLSAYLDRL